MSATRRWGQSALLVALATAPSAAQPVELAGRVFASGRPVAEAVVSVEGLKRESRPQAKACVLDHRDLRFVPHVLVVLAGTPVRFENSDAMPCRIYSSSPEQMFVLRPQDGRFTTLVFDHPGVVEVRCAEHARLLAYVVVKENPYYAVTDARGRYRIRGVPAGSHVVQAWYEGAVLESRTVKVEAAKETLDFAGPRAETSQGVMHETQ